MHQTAGTIKIYVDFHNFIREEMNPLILEDSKNSEEKKAKLSHLEDQIFKYLLGIERVH
jgi:hypothetical protein